MLANPYELDNHHQFIKIVNVLLRFWVTVKAATLIFISWRGSAVSSAQSNVRLTVLFIIGKGQNKLFVPIKRACISLT